MPGRVYSGSRRLIVPLMPLHLIDEIQLCLHPVMAGTSRALFENMHDRTPLKLIRTKTCKSGVVNLYYQPRIP